MATPAPRRRNKVEPGWTPAGVWLKMERSEEKHPLPVPVKKRSQSQRRRRLLLRLAISSNTLLRLKLRIPVDSSLRHPLPIPPAEAHRLLSLIAQGTPLDDVVQEAEESQF